jgi:hypothetical protein
LLFTLKTSRSGSWRWKSIFVKGFMSWVGLRLVGCIATKNVWLIPQFG